MSKLIQAIRGMNDLLPAQLQHWQSIENSITQIVSAYAYQEIRMPILESTHLFKRSIGDVTDIVEKEMYTFDDRNGDSLSLRPEGTASCVRACLQHGLLHNQTQKLWYMGPMFRHERPQKGRYRQFYQMGVEAFGFTGPDIDIEMILISARFWRELGLSDVIRLQINSLGAIEERNIHRQALVDYFVSCKSQLDEDSLRRLNTNPLRILDSKNPSMADVIEKAPKMLDYLSEQSKHHFDSVCQQLDKLHINYEINSCLVRGLDYYSHTVFEWVTDALGAQGTICAGGRYDQLVEQLGGKPIPAVGFAMGIERLVLLYEQFSPLANQQKSLDIYMIVVGELARNAAFQLSESIRNHLPKITINVHCGEASFKSQFKRADKMQAKIALILGDTEVNNQQVGVKYLQQHIEQELIDWQQLPEVLTHYFKGLTS